MADYLLARGDALRLPLADKSVHCAATSPPSLHGLDADGVESLREKVERLALGYILVTECLGGYDANGAMRVREVPVPDNFRAMLHGVPLQLSEAKHDFCLLPFDSQVRKQQPDRGFRLFVAQLERVKRPAAPQCGLLTVVPASDHPAGELDRVAVDHLDLNHGVVTGRCNRALIAQRICTPWTS